MNEPRSRGSEGRGLRRRQQRLLVALIALAALAGAAIIASLVADGGDEPADPVVQPEATNDPANAVRLLAADYLAAWERSDWDTMARVLADPPAAFVHRYEAWSSDLDVVTASFNPGPATIDGSLASVPFEATVGIGDSGTWPYTGSLDLIRLDDRWAVDWSPSVIHPSLRPGDALRLERVWEPRAPILAHDGTPLMTDRRIITVGIVPQRISDTEQLQAALQEHLGVTPGTVTALLSGPGVQPDWFLPVIELRPDAYEELRPVLHPVPGVVFRESTGRLSPTAGFARHVLGRTGEITAELLEQWGRPYRKGDIVGLSGLERRFEETLAGRPSIEIRRVDSAGLVAEVLHMLPGKPPEPLRTTIDVAAQRAVDGAIESVELPAAIVVVHAPSGEIRATASRPLTEFDRALSGLYPPGSTFKIVTATALLEEEMGLGDAVDCPPRTTVGGRVFRNAGLLGLGRIDLQQAFSQSCNTAFAHLGGDLAGTRLAATAELFGFNAPVDLHLSAAGGRYPQPGDLAEQAAAAIGQGNVLASPMHMASVAAAVADGGWRPTRLIASDPEPEARPLDPSITESLRELMRAVVSGGTGTAADVQGHDVFGKTGTPEFGEDDPPATHAWFVGFADDLAFAVLIEGGGSGGAVAAPIAADFLEALDEERAIIAAALAGNCLPADASGWPMFQGLAGHSGCAQRPVIDEPAVLWRTRVGVQGWLNNPVVSGSTVFVGSAGDARGVPDSQDGVYALDLAGGEILWRFPTGDDANGVATAEGLVFATDDQGSVWALRADNGSIAWRFPGPGPAAAFFTNPLVVRDLVVVGDREGIVYAFARRTGELLWSAQLRGAIRGGAASDGSRIFVVGEAGDARAFALDGTELWQTPLTYRTTQGFHVTAQVFAAPTVAEDLVIVPFIRDTTYPDPALVALDASTGSVRWRASDPAAIQPGTWGNLRSSPAVIGDLAVFGDAAGDGLYAVATASGEALWAIPSQSHCLEHWPSPAVAGAVTYLPRDDGRLYAFDTTGLFLSWSIQLQTTDPEDPSGSADCRDPINLILSSPALAGDGTLLVGTRAGELIAVGNAA